SSIVSEMSSASPVLAASQKRLTAALLLVSWAVAMSFLLGSMWMVGWLRKTDPADRSPGPWPWLADTWRRSAPAGGAAPEPSRMRRRARRRARRANGRAGRPGSSAGVHLADLSSDVKSPTGPRCASLSGLTIALMLVI